MTKIKICGLKRSEDIDAANRLRPDYIGFIFAKKSKRYITPAQAEELRKRLDPSIPAVGVFVNEGPEEIAKIYSAGTIQFVQLHGAEDEAYIRKLRSLIDAPLIQAFSVKSTEDLLRAEKSEADYILLDQGAGGSGKQFDWSLLEGYQGRQYFLAGGLNPENAAMAVEKLHPYALDVSSGVETDGKKDKEKMQRLIESVRNQEQEGKN